MMEMKLHGLKDITRALDQLPDKYRRAGEKSALTAGAKPIRAAARSKAPVRSNSGESGENWKPGLLKKSIGSKVKKVRGRYNARVGPRTGFRIRVGTVQSGPNAGKPIYQDPQRYSHLVEYGTAKTPAQPFIRPAVESTKGQVVDAMAEGLEKSLTRAVERLRKKAQ